MENQSEDSSKRILSTDDLIVTYSPLTVMSFLALLIIFAILISSAIILLIENWYGLSMQDAFDMIKHENSLGLRNYIRSVLVINQLFIFVLPSIIIVLFFYKKKWLSFLQLKFNPPIVQSINSLLAILMITAAFPLAQFTLWLNQQIPLPEWMKKMEETTNSLLQNILGIEAPFELFLNLIVIAAIPAFGEELLFRGVIQRNFEKWFRNPHAAIWLAAILFSTFHMQFEGFLPRMLLGAMLGYLYYWAGSLWIPIVAHFVYNAIQIIAVYLYSNQMSTIDIDQIDKTPFGLIIISIIFVFSIGYYFVQFNLRKEI
jgi:membrane protease YdiL (CAAX protease family)